MSIDDLRKIARLRGNKTLAKEDLIHTLLRSGKNLLEDNYIKYIGNNIDDEIKGKINNIRIVLVRLGNIITKKDKNKFRKELYEIEKKKKYTKMHKERIYSYLIELANTLDRKEEYKYSDYNDLDYFGIRDIQNLFDHINNDDYYKPILVKSSFKNSYEYYEIRGDKDKILSIKQYLYIVIPYLAELINKKNKNKEQKIQLSMGVNFMCIIDKKKSRTFYVNSDNEEIRLGDGTSVTINNLTESFLSNY